MNRAPWIYSFFFCTMLPRDYLLIRNKFPHGFIVVFDDTCNLCNKTINFVLDHDKKHIFYFADRDGSAAIALKTAAGLPKDISEKTILVFNDAVFYSQSRAILEIMRHLGFPYSLLYLMIIIPFPVRDFLYRVISKNRYFFFGQSRTCRIMTDDIRSRFL